MNTQLFTPITLLLLSALTLCAADGNRLAYLEASDPFHVSHTFPKLTVDQWLGEPGVDAVIVLAIDDMRNENAAQFETFLRPLLTRLKQIDGRAPVSIFTVQQTNSTQARQLLSEGVNLECHTWDHPCPLLSAGDLDKARRTYDRCVDALTEIPGNRPVAYRMPCLDIWNTTSPRFYAEIFSSTTPRGRFLTMSSSTMLAFSKDDPSLPLAIVTDEEGRERFTKYFNQGTTIFGRTNYQYGIYVMNYPYPIVTSRLCWEIPMLVSDHTASEYTPKYGRWFTKDWEAAVDATVAKRGIAALCFHPWGKTLPHEMPMFVDNVVKKHGARVKFLNFAEVQSCIDRNLLNGEPLRAPDGSDNGVRLIDLNHDGYLDVIIANDRKRETRVWEPAATRWKVTGFPVVICGSRRPAELAGKSKMANLGVQFGILQSNGHPSVLVANGHDNGLWHFDSTEWKPDHRGLRGIDVTGGLHTSDDGRDRGVRLRDLDGDGLCELILGNDTQQAVFAWNPNGSGWRKLPFTLPTNTAVVDAQGRDAGLRFLDLNDDGRLDVFFSNENGYSADLFTSLEHGWNSRTLSGWHRNNTAMPQITRHGTDAGAWVTGGHLWMANEFTDHLPSHAVHVPLSELARQPHTQPKNVPHNQPALVQADPGGTHRLLAAKAELFGEIGKEKIAIYDKEMCIGWWTDEREFAAWNVLSARSGTYDLWLHWSIPDDIAGNLFAIENGPSRVVLTMPSTASFSNFRLAKLGQIHLHAGTNRVVMRPLGQIRGELADVKEIRLTPPTNAVPGLPAGGLSPAETVRTTTVADDLEFSLFASEPLVANPTSIVVDSRGRVWVTEASVYRNPARPEDRVKVLEDTDGDGRADKVTVFSDGLLAPMSLAVAGNKVYVAESPHLYEFEDKDGDLHADGPPRKLLTGFGGYNDDQALHGLTFGPDHKLYFTQGDLSFDVTGPDGVHVKHDVGAVLRCEFDGRGLEVLAWDLKNPIEVAVSSFGDAWFSGNDHDGERMTRLDYTMDGGSYGWRYWDIYGQRERIYGRGAEAHWHVNVMGVIPPVHFPGFGSPCGKLFVETGTLGEKYQGRLVHVDPGPRLVHAYSIHENGAGYTARSETLISNDTDTYFRPIDAALAPDGSMFLCDWYDQGVGGHAYNDPNRGRIYRIRSKSAEPARLGKPGPFTTDEEAISGLCNPNLDAQFLARERLLKSGASALPGLRRLAGETNAYFAARALWLLDRIGGEGRRIVETRLRDPDPRFRVLALRILRQHREQTEKPILRLAHDPSPQVRREILLAITHLQSAEAERVLTELATQWDGTDRFYLEAIGIAARGEAGQAINRFPKFRGGYETLQLSNTIRMDRLFLELVESPGTPFSPRTIAFTQLLRPQDATAYLARRLDDEKLTTENRIAIIAALGPGADMATGRMLAGLIGRSDATAELRRVALDSVRRNLKGPWRELRDDEDLQASICTALGDGLLRPEVLNFIGEVKPPWAESQLIALVQNGSASDSDRERSVAILGDIGRRDAAQLLLRLVTGPGSSDNLRATALRSLVSVFDPESLQSLLLGDKVAADVKSEVLGETAKSTSGALWLLKLIDGGQLSPTLLKQATDAGAAHVDANVRTLYAKLLPESERPRTLSQSIRPQDVLKLTGDVTRGRAVFNSGASACNRCHVVDNAGGEVGPNLSVIGRKYGKEGLLQSILNPSAAISPDYATSLVETKSGDVYLGFLRSSPQDEEVVVKLTSAETIRVPRAEIASVTARKLSLMPEALADAMSAQDVADLLSYLASLTSETQVIPFWWVLGVFPNDNEKGFHTDFGPEAAAGAIDLNATYTTALENRKTKWERVDAEPFQGGRGFDLQRFVARRNFRKGNLVSYCAVAIESPQAQETTLLLGSEDAVKVWVNGTEVHSHFVRRNPARLGQDQVTLKLQQGRNLLLVKLEQVDGGGGLLAALQTKADLRFIQP